MPLPGPDRDAQGAGSATPPGHTGSVVWGRGQPVPQTQEGSGGLRCSHSSCPLPGAPGQRPEATLGIQLPGGPLLLLGVSLLERPKHRPTHGS